MKYPLGTPNLTPQCGTLVGARRHSEAGEGTCRECRDTRSRYMKEWELRNIEGRYSDPFVCVSEVRSRVLAEMEEKGLTASRLSGLLDIPMSSLYRLINPKTQRVRQSTVVLIEEWLESDYSPQLEDLPPRLPAPSLGSRRRLQALMALGYPVTYLEGATGVGVRSLRRILSGEEVGAGLQVRVKEAYEDLQTEWAKDHPRFRQEYGSRALSLARRTSRAAYKKKWAPPAGWWEVDMDDPDQGPVGVDWEALVY